jgi:hypothetical protein
MPSFIRCRNSSFETSSGVLYCVLKIPHCRRSSVTNCNSRLPGGVLLYNYTEASNPTAGLSPWRRKCQDLQVEHMNMRVIDCLDCNYLMEEGPAHRLIVVLRPLGTDQG